MFLNYQKVVFFKSKDEANKKNKELLNKHKLDLEEFKEYVLIK